MYFNDNLTLYYFFKDNNICVFACNKSSLALTKYFDNINSIYDFTGYYDDELETTVWVLPEPLANFEFIPAKHTQKILIQNMFSSDADQIDMSIFEDNRSFGEISGVYNEEEIQKINSLRNVDNVVDRSAFNNPNVDAEIAKMNEARIVTDKDEDAEGSTAGSNSSKKSGITDIRVKEISKGKFEVDVRAVKLDDEIIIGKITNNISPYDDTVVFSFDPVWGHDKEKYTGKIFAIKLKDEDRNIVYKGTYIKDESEIVENIFAQTDRETFNVRYFTKDNSASLKDFQRNTSVIAVGDIELDSNLMI